VKLETYTRDDEGKLQTNICEGSAGDEICASFLGQIVVNRTSSVVASKQGVSYAVVERNGTTDTVYRYTVDAGGKVVAEKLFMINKYAAISNLIVFDDFALVLSDTLAIDVVYFKDKRGGVVPNNFAIKLPVKDPVVKMALVSVATSG